MLSTPLDFLSLVFVPFIGILVRYRAAYHPKRAPTADNETVPTAEGTSNHDPSPPFDDVSASVEPAPTYRNLWRRVKEIEGRAGLFKGFRESILNLIPHSSPDLNTGRKFSPHTPLEHHFTLILVLEEWDKVIHVPLTDHSQPVFRVRRVLQRLLLHRADLRIPVIRFLLCPQGLSTHHLSCNRSSITTTHKLELTGTSITAALRALFTDYERKKPWALWLTPGLAPALIIHIFLQVPVFNSIRRLISIQPLPTSNPVLLACSLGVCLFSTIFLAPLDVIVTRLVIQRNYGPAAAELPTTAPPDVEAQDSEKADMKAVELDHEAEHGLLAVRYVNARMQRYLI